MTEVRRPMAAQGAGGGRGDRLRAALIPAGAGAAALAAVAYVGLVDPGEPGHYPMCPFLMLTGLYCPGCGTLRAVHALAHGDPVAALGLNPLAVVLIPLAVWWWGRWLAGALRGGPWPAVRVRPVLLWIGLGVTLAYWVVRNLPFAAFLAP
ncbi:DUF2752 domain-containing protein [Spongiactinospora sp. 9N601]|uniref:DUF2752 domain-containing protein n=1 Tax=Spongiactinospora sp. 9N601 TaxID=3375149 RepID=UPI00379DEED8